MASTIKDVARLAGVSVATVSRALNGAENVLPDTRLRVVEAAKQLRFTPSGAARSLIMRRTEAVGALLPDLHGEYFSELIRGIDVAAREHGLHLLVSSSHGDSSEAAKALRAMAGRVDGLLVMSPHADLEFLSLNLLGNVPAVLVNTGSKLAGHASFEIDNYGGAKAMTEHFLSLGYRRIAFIGGPKANYESCERQRGYREALGNNHVAHVFEGDFTESSGWAAGRDIVQALPAFDAVFAANDMMAIGCMAALNEAGLRVPQDIALGGFDDIPISRYVAPALSTVHSPTTQLGHLAMQTLAGLIEEPGSKVTHNTVLPVELVIRRSCGAQVGTKPATLQTL